jgi:hypothetical protein
MIKQLFLFLVCFLFFFNTSQSQCLNSVSAFQPGEKLYYEAFYNWGFIWVHAGDVMFSVNSKVYQSKPVYSFETKGNSLKSYDWIYKVRDTFQSYVDFQKFQSLWFRRNTCEGGYKAYEQYTFDESRDVVYTKTENSKKKYTKDTLKTKPCTFDVLTAIYYCRSLPIEKYKVDEKIPINVIIDNAIYSLYLRFKGKETIKTRNNQYFKCIKFSALLVEGTIFKGGEDMFIWVTDDDNRVPVLVEAKILIGSVKAYLVKTDGLRNPQTALLSGKK